MSNLSLISAGSRAEQPDIIRDKWQSHLLLQEQAGAIAYYTRITYQRGFQKFWLWLIDNRQDTTSEEVIRAWLADVQKTRSPATASTWLTGVRNFFIWAVEAGYLEADPTEGIEKPRRDSKQHKRKPLTDQEVLDLLHAPDISTHKGIRDRAILFLLAFSGLRGIEVIRMDFADISIREDTGELEFLVWGKRRRGKDEYAGLSEPAGIRAVLEWLQLRETLQANSDALFISLGKSSHGNRLSSRTLSDLINIYYKQVGITDKHKTVHSIRHWSISNVLRNGGNLYQAKILARHKHASTTELYLHELDRRENPPERLIHLNGLDNE